MISCFEDLDIWQGSTKLAISIYTVCREGAMRKEWSLNDQMKRAALSIPSNIAEGFERGSAGDFRRFLSIAKASCGELRTQLYIASELNFITKEKFAELSAECLRLSAMIASLIIRIDERKTKTGKG